MFPATIHVKEHSEECLLGEQPGFPVSHEPYAGPVPTFETRLNLGFRQIGTGNEIPNTKFKRPMYWPILVFVNHI